MSETTEPTPFEGLKDTEVYTYSVNMIVQVIAPNEDIAREKLDRDGGYVSKRDVELTGTTRLYTDDEDAK